MNNNNPSDEDPTNRTSETVPHGDSVLTFSRYNPPLLDPEPIAQEVEHFLKFS